jgi:hypothetical protein
LYGPHLPVKARRENRSRQEKRYGKHTVHIQSSIHFCEALGLLPTRGMICCPRQRLIKEDNTTYRLTKCHGTVKNFASHASDDNLFATILQIGDRFLALP